MLDDMLQRYALISHLLLACSFGHISTTVNGFYDIITRFLSNKTCVAILYNYCLMLFIFCCKIPVILFFGQLTQLEGEQLMENTRNYIMDTILFLVLSKPRYNGKEVLMSDLVKCITLLVSLKSFHILLYIRLSHMFEVEVPRFFKIFRLSTFIYILSLINCFLLNLFLTNINKKNTFTIWIIFELLGMLQSLIFSTIKFIINLIDLFQTSGLVNKVTLLFYIELLHDISSLVTFTIFMILFFLNNPINIPIYMIIDIIHVAKNLSGRIKMLIEYRKLSKVLGSRFPKATKEEIDKELTCIICRDNLDLECRRIDCGHIYHLNCLKSWLFQHSSCPSCRSRIHSTSDTSGVTLIDVNFVLISLERRVISMFKVWFKFGKKILRKLGVGDFDMEVDQKYVENLKKILTNDFQFLLNLSLVLPSSFNSNNTNNNSNTTTGRNTNRNNIYTDSTNNSNNNNSNGNSNTSRSTNVDNKATGKTDLNTDHELELEREKEGKSLVESEDSVLGKYEFYVIDENNVKQIFESLTTQDLHLNDYFNSRDLSISSTSRRSSLSNQSKYLSEKNLNDNSNGNTNNNNTGRTSATTSNTTDMSNNTNNTTGRNTNTSNSNTIDFRNYNNSNGNNNTSRSSNNNNDNNSNRENKDNNNNKDIELYISVSNVIKRPMLSRIMLIVPKQDYNSEYWKKYNDKCLELRVKESENRLFIRRYGSLSERLTERFTEKYEKMYGKLTRRSSRSYEGDQYLDNLEISKEQLLLEAMYKLVVETKNQMDLGLEEIYSKLTLVLPLLLSSLLNLLEEKDKIELIKYISNNSTDVLKNYFINTNFNKRKTVTSNGIKKEHIKHLALSENYNYMLLKLKKEKNLDFTNMLFNYQLMDLLLKSRA